MQKIVRKYLNRCALHGLIYLWDLKSTTKSLTEETKKDKIIEKEVRWDDLLAGKIIKRKLSQLDAILR